VDSAEEKDFKKFVGELVRPKLKEIGLKTRKSDDENTIRLRAVLLGLDFYAETAENIQALAKMYDKDYAKLDAEIREDIIDAKLYEAPEMVDEYLGTYQEIADPEIKFELLFAGTISKNEKVLAKMMELLEKPEIVKPQDQLHLFVYMYRNPKTRDAAGEWLTKHWDYVKNLAGDKSLDSYPRYMANMIRTEAEYKLWREFFGPMADNPALARAIEIGKKEIEARIKLAQRNQKTVAEAVSKTLHS
jgi:aminopeptidase N